MNYFSLDGSTGPCILVKMDQSPNPNPVKPKLADQIREVSMPQLPWDNGMPDTIYARSPQRLREAIEQAHKLRPTLFGIEERYIFTYLRNNGKQPSPADNQLRLQFWFAYNQAMAEGREIREAEIYAGVCEAKHFWEYVCVRPEKLAWLLTPPMSYTTRLKEASEFGLRLMREILEQEGTEMQPNIRLKLWELQVKIFHMLDSRLHGATVQKHLNVNITDKEAAKELMAESMDQIQTRLKELELREKKNWPEVPMKIPGKEPVFIESNTVEGPSEGELKMDMSYAESTDPTTPILED